MTTEELQEAADRRAERRKQITKDISAYHTGKRRHRIRFIFSGLVFCGFLTSDIICLGVILILYYSGVLNSVNIITAVWMGITLISSTVLGALLGLFYTIWFLKPLEQIIAATQRIAEGDFTTYVALDAPSFITNSEFATLTDSFNHMTAELAGTELFRKDFISNFSHEFKTPIISIRGFARQLLDENLPREQQLEFAKIIAEEAEMLAGMSSNVLLLTKFEHQEIVSEKTNFSLDEQLRRCFLLFEEQWTALNLTIDMELDEVSCYSNEDMLACVWTNLFSNAMKFSKQDGALYIACQAKDDCVVVTVRDSGTGMDKETVQHIFEKFYQGDISHASKGNGLGLTLVRRILYLLGGEIKVESALGFGSTFIVTLPL